MNPKPITLEEFQEFLADHNESTKAPPAIVKKIQARIFPSLQVVAIKLGFIHLFVGFASLAICDQFGLNPFGTEQFLTTWWMNLTNHEICMILCGFFFVTATYALSNFVLSLEEISLLSDYKWITTGALGVASLASFHLAGGELLFTFALFWAAGAQIFGGLALGAMASLRSKLSLASLPNHPATNP